MVQSVWVQTDDPTTPRLELKLSGTVDVLVELVPAYLQLGQVAVGTTRTESVRVIAKDVKDFQILEALPSEPDRVKAKIVQTPDGPSVQIAFEAGSTTGVAGGLVSIRTNHPKAPEVSLNYRAEVIGDLSVTPLRITFAPPSPDREAEPVEVQVKSASGKPFRIVKAVDPAGLVQTRIVAGKKGTTLRLTAQEAPKPIGGTIVLTTNRKDQPSLVVNYVMGSGQRPGRVQAKTPRPQIQRRPPGPIQPPTPRIPQRVP